MTKQKLILKGKAYWTRLNKPNDEGYFTLELGHLDNNSESLLKKQKITLKNKDMKLAEKGYPEMGNFVTLKSKFAPAIEGTEGQLVGNGSEVEVQARAYEWSYKGKQGISLGLDAVKVINLIPYVSKTVSLDEESPF